MRDTAKPKKSLQHRAQEKKQTSIVQTEFRTRINPQDRPQ